MVTWKSELKNQFTTIPKLVHEIIHIIGNIYVTVMPKCHWILKLN